MAEDYVPGKDVLFDTFIRNIVTYTGAKCGGASPAWTHIPQEAFQELSGACGAWVTAYEKTKIPHTPVDTAEKTRLRAVSEKILRNFVNRFLRYDPVTDEDRDNMGIPNKKAGHSPVAVPRTSPVLLLDTGTRRRVIIRYKDENSTRRGKPKGVRGIEVRWALLDKPPSDIEELIHSSFDTNPPLTLTFDEKERGRHIYMAGAWEIEREGEKGPFSAIEEAIVP
jgi:hypothetical protein